MTLYISTESTQVGKSIKLKYIGWVVLNGGAVKVAEADTYGDMHSYSERREYTKVIVRQPVGLTLYRMQKVTEW